ncbi:Protein of unknown function DUF2273 [Coriobacterium glomerans PW2]|uniref:Small integral membrane protein n=1 Tax=Coriobacterium glomerans (strain ATCC 49209 / DSM 20642 / JCM 10262 / PW2) TaxID=700015 RepID=F2N761_CORGP|nr:DUF2273 domain-containing protein [Coriobacterium glomerans]AEB06400.1 Protein of unknown function DUF2273 [Coriobacterium glomerans PW2]
MSKSNNGGKAPKTSIERNPKQAEKSTKNSTNDEDTSKKENSSADGSQSSRADGDSSSSSASTGSTQDDRSKQNDNQQESEQRKKKGGSQGDSDGSASDPVGFFAGFGRSLWSYASKHPHSTLFALIGFILALFILGFGLWHTIVIALFVLIGAAIGQILDGDTGIIGFFARLFKDRS